MVAGLGALVAPGAAAQDLPELEVYAEGFEFLTNLAYVDGRLFATEKESGEVLIVDEGRRLDEPFATLDVYGGAERGLLGIAAHPRFPDEPWLYLYLSDGSDQRNRVIRVRAEGDRAAGTERVIDLLPAGSGYHNGGDIAFGPDGNLYVVTGEAHDPQLAQDPRDLGGKILRLEADGSVPADNPLDAESPVYSLGHRNSFGVCIDAESGRVWQTENGPQSHDEVNRIEPGGNYGWPEVSGPGGGDRFIDPVIDYPQIIIPTGCAVTGGNLWWGDYSGTLHVAPVRGDGLGEERRLEVGRGITDVLAAPDGYLYVAATDVILRARIGSPSPSPTEADPTPAPPGRSPSAPAPDAASDEGGSTAAIVIIAILLGLGLVAMRGRIRPPPGPTSP